MYSSAEIARVIDSYVSLVGNSLNNPENPFPRGEEAKSRWLEQFAHIRELLQEVSLRQLIDAIGEFPVVPVVLDTTVDNINCVFQLYKNRPQALSWLLKPLMLGEPLLDNNPFEMWFYYLVAQISKARFDLATETYIRSSLLQIYFPSAAVLWACCECSISRASLERSGLIGNPIILGKTDYFSHEAQTIRDYKNFEVKAKSGPPDFDVRLYLSALLDWEAYKIAAQKDEGYFEEHYYRPFFRLLQRFNNFAKRKDVQGIYLLPDEEIFVTGSHNKIPKGCQSKQFSAFLPKKTKRQRNKNKKTTGFVTKSLQK